MNGDPIVLNIETMRLGYIFHDKLWPDNSFKTLESIYIDLGLSIGEFFHKAMTEEGFPIDAFDAEEYIK